MALKELVLEQIKTAMKSKDQFRVDTLRFLQSAIKNREIDLRPNAITEDDVLGVIKKLAKQRKESIEQYQNGGRPELAQKEANELKILEEFLPKSLGQEETLEIIKQVIAELGATQIKQMGQVMKLVMEKTQGAADNRFVSETIKSLLQG